MMEEFCWINIFFTVFVFGLSGWPVKAQNDYSGPIKCYYCFGEADNSSCADPVNPRKDKGSLEVIECEHGICLKWTSYWHKRSKRPFGDMINSLAMVKKRKSRLNVFWFSKNDSTGHIERKKKKRWTEEETSYTCAGRVQRV